jgi:DNA-binding SARP family transcriptional activator/predicted ATPase
MSFFGAFHVTLAQEPITHFRSSNIQGLLVYLVLQAGRPLPREVLAAMFWPDESEQNARNNLRQSLYRLRRLLGDANDGDAPYLLANSQSVQFNPESDYTVDVYDFLRAIEAGDLASAVTHYQGELLPGFTCDSLGFEEWLRQEREHLHQLALEALTEVAQAHLQHGRLAEAQAAARQQLSLEPWREPAFRQLMQAYALVGDRGNALAQYELCRQRLADELGINPAPETTALYEQIQAGRFRPIASDEMLRPPVKVRHNLPADTTPFIGRELELARIQRVLGQEGQRLVTIVGPGGMGKTRLALAAGAALLDQYRDGVYLIELAPLTDPQDIGPAIATALDYQAPDSAQALLPQLLSTLSRQNVLLILDNFEHLLAGAALVNDILQTCPQVTILVTSRQRLNLASEGRFELGGLDFADCVTPEEALGYTAVQLFLDSGRRVQPDLLLDDENVADIIRICQLVQGMPLGLVLAAAWLELLSPAEIAAEIERGLGFLAADLADLPARQRSMEAVFERSWKMMTPNEQASLARLSVFRGGFTREAAEQVAGTNLRVLLSLVNKSLLHRQADGGRFTMHELLRQFAAQQRRQAGPNEEIALAHCRYFAGQLADEIQRAHGFHLTHVPKHLTADRENYRRAWALALERGLGNELIALVKGMVAFGFAQGVRPDAYCQQAIQALEKHDVPASDRTMLYLQVLDQGNRVDIEDRSLLRPRFDALAPVLEVSGDPELLFWFYERLGFLTNSIPGSQEALVWWQMARTAARKMGNEVLVRWAESLDIWFRAENGLSDESDLPRLRELLAFFESDFPNSIAIFGVLLAMGLQSADYGAYDQAIPFATRATNIAKGWQNLKWTGHAVYRTVSIFLRMDRPDQAGYQLLDFLDWHLAIGQVWQTLGCLWSEAADFPQLIGGFEKAVAIMSMVFHHPEAIPHYRQQIAEARRQFEDAMGQEAYAAAWERGKQLDFEEVISQVRSVLISAGG